MSSVTAFSRVAHAIWKLGTKLLCLMWSSYFDDFFSVEGQELSRQTELVISSLFSILGWKLSVDKLVDYALSANIWGLSSISECPEMGFLSFATRTPLSLNFVKACGVLHRADVERLRGRLQFHLWPVVWKGRQK